MATFTQHRSLAELMAGLSQDDQHRLLDMVPREVVEWARYDPTRGFGLRRGQRLPVGDWQNWLLLAGRGFGKTHVLSSVAHQWGLTLPSFGIIGATSDDTRRILVEGPSGILATAPKWRRPIYRKADRMLEWPATGSRAYLFSAEVPDRLRGANLAGLLADELAAWPDPEEVWAQAQLTLRIGDFPRSVIATTPRPIPLIRQLASDPSTFLTVGSTYENTKLSKNFIKTVIKAYEGTRLGRQELEGAILTEVDSALWTSASICYAPHTDLTALRRVVIGVDPAGGGRGGDTTGIVAAGLLADGSLIVLEDASIHGSPSVWAGQVARVFDKWRADAVICEINYGGQLCVDVLHQSAPNLPVRVVHATRGKVVRAEPIALLAEQGRLFLLHPMAALETQLLGFSASHGWMGAGSPDRADAAIWACTGLIGTKSSSAPIASGVAPVSISKWVGRAG
jgi:phage terminase large subunit-like protein